MKDKMFNIAAWMIFTAGIVIGWIVGILGIDLRK